MGNVLLIVLVAEQRGDFHLCDWIKHVFVANSVNRNWDSLQKVTSVEFNGGHSDALIRVQTLNYLLKLLNRRILGIYAFTNRSLRFDSN